MWNIKNGIVKFYELRVGGANHHVIDTCCFIIRNIVGANNCLVRIDGNAAYIKFKAGLIQYRNIMKELDRLNGSLMPLGVFMAVNEF